jgi:hypothetical protein
MKWISSEAIKQGVSFDEICIELDYELTSHKTYLKAFRKHLNKDYHVVICVLCNQKIRINDFGKSVNLACPKCNCILSLAKDHLGTIIIQLQENTSHSSGKEEPERCETSIKSCFDILGIPPTASQDEAKKAYRKIITQYHPDKVSHLGVEFQRLAESKTKELNEAYFNLCNILK